MVFKSWKTARTTYKSTFFKLNNCLSYIYNPHFLHWGLYSLRSPFCKVMSLFFSRENTKTLFLLTLLKTSFIIIIMHICQFLPP